MAVSIHSVGSVPSAGIGGGGDVADVDAGALDGRAPVVEDDAGDPGAARDAQHHAAARGPAIEVDRQGPG